MAPVFLPGDPPPSAPLGPAGEPQTQEQGPSNLGAPESEPQSWKFVLLLSALATYDNNIFIQPVHRKGDFYFHLDPTFAVGLGNFRETLSSFAPIPHFLVRTGEEDLPWKDFVYASYTPDGVLFAKYHKEDVVNHDVKVAGQKERDLWNLSGDLHFQTESDPVIDVGRRIKQTYYTGDAAAAYNFTGKLTGGLKLKGTRSEYSGGFNSDDGSAGGFLDYQVAPKTALGAGVTAGYLDATHGANQTYEQPFLEVKYLPTEKLSFSGQAGAEFRQFSSHLGNRSHFIFDLSGGFAPADGTTITLSGRRDTIASAEYTGENIVETLYQAEVRQRFLQRIYVGASGGLVHDHYENNQTRATIARHDDYYFYKLSASRDVTKNATVALSYEHRRNDSSLSNFTFSEDLATFAVSVLF